MRLDDLYLWYLGDPAPRYVGALQLVAAGKGVSPHYGEDLLRQRQAFDEGKYQAPPPKRRPTSPFRKT